jgi:hypothetical protein
MSTKNVTLSIDSDLRALVKEYQGLHDDFQISKLLTKALIAKLAEDQIFRKKLQDLIEKKNAERILVIPSISKTEE